MSPTAVSRVVSCIVLLVALPGLAAAQRTFTIETVVVEGDDVPGVGRITRIDNLAVNDAGQTLVEADTDNPDTALDSILLLDGELLLREGDPLAEPVAPVALVAGVHDGMTPIPCGGVVDIASPQPLGVARANAFGMAVLAVPIPQRAEGRSPLFQAIEPGVCAVSNRVTIEF